MILVRFQGGLGNQLFQYAAARRLAVYHHTRLKLDVSWFRTIPPGMTPRTYDLGHFNIQQSFATPGDIAAFRPQTAHKIRQFFLRAVSTLDLRRWVVFKETQLGVYNPNILKTPKSVYLVGYWQSERYFKDIEPLLRREFTFKTAQDAKNTQTASLIQSVQAVSVHIRRGDYVADPRTHEYHGLVPLEYYHVAADKIAHAVTDPRFFVFSDEPEWAQEHLKLNYPITFMMHNGQGKHYEDLRLMSLCKHHIIANSSFSWWGAWLSINPDKLVFAPTRWFNQLDTQDLIPETWHKI
jgi:hypothetical protein